MPLTETTNPQSGDADDAREPSLAVRANRYDMLSRLADDLAHEIKNPLNAIVVNLEVLRRRVGSGAVDSALDRAVVIDHEIRRVHALVEQLLQLLRPAKAESKLVAVDGILDSLATALQIQAKAARIGLEWESEPDLYARIRSEPFRFALLNLVTRAIDVAAQSGGQVGIKARRAADEIYLAVTCSSGVLSPDDEYIRFCRQLMADAGGALESVEPNHGAAGSTATVVMPAGGFA